MTAYTKSTNFATKDTLTSGDPLKIVKGTEINTEFDNIATAVNSKSDTASPTFTGTVTIPILSYAGTTLSAAVTGTGKMVLDTSPTLSTPALGTPSALVGTNITGTAAGLTAGNVTTNANLTGAITSVGNSTSLGSFTSSQLLTALTDETGTGSAVFATSPTLVTPILGTPTSGVLTNCTGVQYTGFKNRIINGAMVIDQRNAGASVTPATGAYTLDRWTVEMSQASKFSVQQNAGSVTPPAGFASYLGATSLSAYTVGASEYFVIGQAIEGYNVADLAFGTANASAMTLSFWVRSSLTGTFGGTVLNSGASRNYVFSYTISAANTWEQKTVTIAGDTSGTWLTTNGAGLYVRFSIGAGSSVTTAAGSWSGTTNRSVTGQTSVVGTNGATFYITGVQLEKGSTATSFDYRPYGTELALCQRYFISYGGDSVYERFANCVNTSTTQAVGIVSFPIQMRIAPAITSSGSFGLYNGSAIMAVTTIAVDSAATKVTSLTFNVAAGLSANAFTQAIANNSTATRLTFSAEL